MVSLATLNFMFKTGMNLAPVPTGGSRQPSTLIIEYNAASQRRQSTVVKNLWYRAKISGRKFTMKHGNNGNNGNQSLTLPRPQNQTTNPVSTTIVTAPKAEPVAMIVSTVEELLRAVAEGKVVRLSAEAKAEVENFKTAHETLESPKRLAAAEAEALSELPKLLEGIAGKYKVNFSGRKITVVFKSTPKDGEPNPLVSFGPEVEVLPGAKKRSGGGGHGKGFKSGGEVILHVETGKELHFNSLHALAINRGWKYEGRATSQIAITNPCTQAEWDGMDSNERKNLPAKYRIELTSTDGKNTLHIYPAAAS
jgi:hypothetical protein